MIDPKDAEALRQYQEDLERELVGRILVWSVVIIAAGALVLFAGWKLG